MKAVVKNTVVLDNNLFDKLIEDGILMRDNNGNISMVEKEKTIQEPINPAWRIETIHMSLTRSIKDTLTGEYDGHIYDINVPKIWTRNAFIAFRETTDVVSEKAADSKFSAKYSYNVYRISVGDAIDIMKSKKTVYEDLPMGVTKLLIEIMKKNWSKIKL